MKFMIAFVLTLAVNFSAQADSVTWGKRVVFKIRTVKYEGKVYSGALIASSAQISKLDGPEVIEIRNPRILVYGAGALGLDKVFELASDTDESKAPGYTSPLCKNVGKARTQMYDAYGNHNAEPLAMFVDKDTVEIGMSEDTHFITRDYVTCADVHLSNN